MSYSPDDFREVAWNGICFSAPSSWHPATIEANYLALEDTHGPILELKWHEVQGNRARKAHLSNLRGRYSRRLGKFTVEESLPKEWQPALDGYLVSGFSRGGETGGILGVIAYCPDCHRVSLIQFHRRGSRFEKEIQGAILASFRDHRPDRLTQWAVYDLRAVVPRSLALNDHQFQAGEFKLSFRDKKSRLILSRWAPASVILSHVSLGEFAADKSGCGLDHFKILDEEKGTVAEAQVFGIGKMWSGRRGKWPFGGGYKMLRFWTVEDKNRLLAVEMTGRGTLDHDLFRLVCQSYEAV